jgi:hypothetical protein
MSQAVIPPSSVVSSIADWKRLYQYAILEHDASKVPPRVAEPGHAILNRAKAPVTKAKVGESSDLIYALRMLGLLEKVAARERAAA